VPILSNTKPTAYYFFKNNVSVFSTPPPNFSIREATTLVQDLYGLTAELSPLTSDRDQNFLCITDQDKYILKIYNPDEDKSVLELQNECIKYIKERDPALQVPVPYKNFKTIESGDTTLLVRIVEFLPGKFLMDVDHHNDLLYELGSFLGRLRTAMNGFDHPAGHRDFPWDVAYVDFIKGHKHYLKSKEYVVDHFIEHYEQIVFPIASELRKAIIHNDGNDHNILVNKKGFPNGIIDFGDMVHTFVACEPAVCMAYVALGKDNPLDSIAYVLKGFYNSFPLNVQELSVVIYLVCLRLCITVTMAAYRKQLFPENKYISVSEDQAWDFLEKMHNEDLNKWSDKLVEYAQS
jgi:Ser/Thr protein kinase RdoA (MazF antagonist)